MIEIGIDNPLKEKDSNNYKAEKDGLESDLIKYVIADRLKPNKLLLGQKKQDFIKYLDLFKGVQKRKHYEGLANLFIPEILKGIETLVSIIHFGIFGNPVFMKYRGYEPSDEISAQNMTDVNYYCMAENQFELNFSSFERNMFVYGTAIGKVLWDFDEIDVASIDPEGKKEKRLETIRDTWTFQNVDILNFWIPPETPWWDIQKARWMAETEEVDESWIREKMRSGWISKTQGEKLLRAGAGSVGADYSSQLKDERLQSSNIPAQTRSDKGRYKITTWYGLIPYKFVKDKEDSNDDDDLVLGICILGNDSTTLKLDKVSNVFWHNRYPYVSSTFIPLDGEFFGLGVPSVCDSLQEELNDTRNQTMDNKTAILRNMWLLDRNAQIARKDLEMRPNGIIMTNNMQGLVPLAPPLFTGVGVSIEGVIKEDIRQAIAAISGLQGIPQAGVGSATEFSGLQNSAMGRSRMVIKTLAESAIKPIFNLAKFLIYQFYDHRKMIRVVGARGIKTKFLSPDEIAGNYDIFLELSTDFEKNPNVMRQQLLTLFSQLVGLPPQAIQFHWKLISKLMSEMGIKNPEDYYADLAPVENAKLLTPEEEHQILLAFQPVHANKGDDDLIHLRDHIEFRAKIYLSAPPYILNNIDNHIKEHQASLQAKGRQPSPFLGNGQAGGMIPGQNPNTNFSTMQNPTSDNEILKGVENV